MASANHTRYFTKTITARQTLRPERAERRGVRIAETYFRLAARYHFSKAEQVLGLAGILADYPEDRQEIRAFCDLIGLGSIATESIAWLDGMSAGRRARRMAH